MKDSIGRAMKRQSVGSDRRLWLNQKNSVFADQSPWLDIGPGIPLRVVLGIILVCLASGCERHSPSNSPDVDQLVDAIRSEDSKSIDILITRGAGLLKHTNMRGHWSYPIHYAACEGDITTLEKLLAAGADPNQKDSEGHTPVMHACFGYGNHSPEVTIKAIRFLAANGADVNQKAVGYFDVTALHFSAKFALPDVAEVLIELGADVDARMKGGLFDANTPLHNASNRPGENAVQVARILIDAGADVTATNGASLTAREVAMENDHALIAEILKKAQHDSQKPE